jgi:hypothetical protein
MPDIRLIDNIERLTRVREKLAFIYDSFTQSNSFEFSTFGGNFGIGLILEELVNELQEIESALAVLLRERR